MVIGRKCTSPYQTPGWPFNLLPWRQNWVLLVVGTRPQSSDGIALSIHPRQARRSSWASQSIPHPSYVLQASHPYPAIAIQLPRALSSSTFPPLDIVSSVSPNRCDSLWSDGDPISQLAGISPCTSANPAMCAFPTHPVQPTGVRLPEQIPTPVTNTKENCIG